MVTCLGLSVAQSEVSAVQQSKNPPRADTNCVLFWFSLRPENRPSTGRERLGDWVEGGKGKVRKTTEGDQVLGVPYGTRHSE